MVMKNNTDQKKNTDYQALPIPLITDDPLVPYINNELQVLSEVISKLNDDILMIRTHLGI
jgi:hypothetical protein